ncbi:citrate synthase [Urbifossiella limnaea]|uniref:Citrate synthase n=1 Tax=Urbifossiella limnaea TaxID=2528023 RepID=A0A517XS60_9BACT|nr:citrate synthase [Urbifossiella limnaea]QDU20347.1 Citrate synthase [Urbifossiella limnaea]
MSTEPEYRPGLEDVPAAKSAVSFLDGKKARLEYRGIPVEVLAKESCFEEVAWLLIKGDLPTQKQLAEFDHDLRHRRAIHYRLKDLVKCLPADGHPMDALHATVAALGMFYPCKTVSDPAKNWDATLRLVAAMPTVVTAFARARRGEEILEPRADLDHSANFYYMLTGKEPTPATRKVLDACLILHAEHTMNASTFTARVTGSTLANPYHVVGAAIGSLAGPLHGGANEEVLHQLAEIGSVENVKPWLDAKRAADPKFKVMGLGHRVYKVKDGRATVVQEVAEQAFAETSRPKTYEIALELEKYCEGIYGPKGIYPNVDFYSGVVYQSLGIPVDVFTPIFAIARVAGWLAHWHEQLVGNRIFRPEQISTGKHDVKYVPLAERP